MDNYSVMISATAGEDAAGIVDYIAYTLLDPQAAIRLIGRLKEAVKSLETMPERHPLVADTYLALCGIRTLLVDNYCVFYAVNRAEHTVNIIRVIYTKRAWEKLI